MPLLYGQRRDGNEHEIVAAMRQLGATVEYMDKSAGFDLLVAYRGQLFAVEVKQPGEELRKSEAALMEKINRHGDLYRVVYSVDEVMDLLGWVTL